MNDSELIWEAYIGNDKPDLLEESVWSTIVEIFNDLRTSMKHGLKKEDLVYYLSLIKSRSENYYRSLMKEMKQYVAQGMRTDKYDKIRDTIILIIFNIVAFGISVGAVAGLHKTGLPNKAIDYAFEHKAQVIQFIDDIEQAVDSVASKVIPK